MENVLKEIFDKLGENQNDINQLQKYNRELIEIYSLALEATREGVWDWNIASGQVKFSRRWFEILGYDDSDNLAHEFATWEKLIHPDDKQNALDKVYAHLNSGNDRMEASRQRLLQKDGTYRYTLHHGKATFDENGTPIRMVGTMQDIHEQVENEQQLHASRRFVRSVVDSNPNLIFVKDQQGNFTFVNEATAKLFNMSVADLTNKNNHKVHNNEDELAHYDQVEKQVLQEDRAISIRETFTLPDGKVTHYHTVKAPIIAEDGTRQVLGVATDISEVVETYEAMERMKKEKESTDLQFTLALESMDFVLYGVAWNMKKKTSKLLSSTNEYINSFFSVSDWQKHFGANIRKYLGEVHPEDRSAFIAFSRKVLQDTSRQVFNLAYRFRINGEYRWQEDHVYSIHSSDEITLYVLSKDVTERMNTEEKLKVAFEKERDLNKLKSQFVSMTSHEFRTPLTAIRSSVEIMEMIASAKGSISEEKIQPLVGSILVEIDRLTELMNDVLILGKLDAEKVSIKRTPVSVSRLMNQVLYLEQLQADTDILLDIQEGDKEVMLDFTLISHVVRNLIQNAIKYGNSDKPAIFKSSFIGDDLVMEVQDFGIGIPKEEQKNLFQSFYRASNAETIKGTGLGLVIVKEFIEMHEGQIILESEEGKGSKFTIIIPAA